MSNERFSMGSIGGAAGLAAIALLAAGLTGCASSGPTSESQQAMKSMQKIEAELTDARTAVQHAVASLDKLEQTDDVVAAYREFDSAVAEVESYAEQAKKGRETMEARKAAFLTEWSKRMEQVKDESLKEAAAARRAQLEKAFGDVRLAVERARKAYEPFVAGVTDLRTYLPNDLSKNGVETAAKTIETTRQRGNDLSGALAALLTELSEARRAMGAAPSGK